MAKFSLKFSSLTLKLTYFILTNNDCKKFETNSFDNLFSVQILSKHVNTKNSLKV